MTVADDLATPVGMHECATCKRCATTYAIVHPVCPKCAEQKRVEDEIARLQQELELGKALDYIAGWRERAEAAEAEVARLKDGLRFYANEDSYLWHGNERGTIQKNDRGAHARALLAEDGAAITHHAQPPKVYESDTSGWPRGGAA